MNWCELSMPDERIRGAMRADPKRAMGGPAGMLRTGGIGAGGPTLALIRMYTRMYGGADVTARA